MVKIIIGLCAFLFLLPLHAQHIDLKVCNDIKTLEERNNCLTASLENLITKDLEKNMEMLRLQPGDSVPLKLEVTVSGVGNFEIKSIQTPSFAVARAVDAAITALKPLEIYRDENDEIVRANLSIETVFTTNNNGSLETSVNKVPDVINLPHTNEVPFAIIENVPVFPGCNNGTTNKERKDCMSLAIQTHVVSNFDLSMANSLDLLPGQHRIAVQFKINQDGFVTDVISRGPHPLLEKEASRIVASLPKMVPGKQKGQNVSVLYSLPIIFVLEGDNKQKKKRKG